VKNTIRYPPISFSSTAGVPAAAGAQQPEAIAEKEERRSNKHNINMS
jgi:hypothetical protein